jgi:hypothetical protein
MATHNSSFDPLSSKDWASALGMVAVPLFGSASGAAHAKPQGEYAVLLDGRRSSLTICSGKDLGAFIHAKEPLSWSWSANLRHTLIVNEKANSVIWRRWDLPSFAQGFRLPRSRTDAQGVFSEIENAKNIQATDVVARMLTAFRQVRKVLSPFNTDPVISVRRGAF